MKKVCCLLICLMSIVFLSSCVSIPKREVNATPISMSMPETKKRELKKVEVSNPDVKLMLEVGYNNYFIVTKPTTLKVNVINDSSLDIDGDIVLRLDQNEYSADKIDYVVAVEVKAQESKIVELDFVSSSILDMSRVYLMDGHEWNIEDMPIAVSDGIKSNIMRPEQSFIGIWSEPKSAIDYWKSITYFPHHGEVKAVDINENNFPKNNFLMGNFCVLVLHHADLSKLSESQIDVLKSWINDGGNLYVDGDQGGKITLDGLSDIIELKAQGTQSEINSIAELSALADYNFTGTMPISNLPDDGTVLLQTGSVPLIKRYDVGNGAIIVSAFDMSSGPFKTQGAKNVWENLDIYPDADETMLLDYQQDSSGYGNYDLGSVLRNIPEMDPPDIGWILLIMVFFVILAGPINYIVLKKMDKRDWIWATAPTLSIAFCAIVFFIGKNIKGTNLETSTITQLFDYNAGKYKGTTFIGVKIPKTGGYEFNVGKNGMINNYTNPYDDSIFRPTYYGGPEGLEDLPDNIIATINTDANDMQSIEFGKLRQWTMPYFAAYSEIKTKGALETIAYLKNDKINIKMTNNTGVLVEDVLIFSNIFGYAEVDSLPDGQTTEFELGDKYKMAMLGNAGAQQFEIWSILNSKYGDYDNATNKPREKDDEQARLDRTKMMYLQSNTRFQYSSTGIQMVAWTKDLGMLDVYSKDQLMQNANHWGIISETIPISLGEQKEISIPYGFIQGTYLVEESQGNNFFYNNYNGIQIELINGFAVLDFTFDANKKYQIEEMTIRGNSNSQDILTYLLNTQTGQYEKYNFESGLTGENARKYIDKWGSIKLKLDSGEQADKTVSLEDQQQTVRYIDSIAIMIKGKERIDAAS